MQTVIKYLNNGLSVLIITLVITGLTLNFTGNLSYSTKVFFVVAVIIPMLLASKGVEFMLSNHFFKAFLSIVLLSLVCMMSIVFVFV